MSKVTEQMPKLAESARVREEDLNESVFDKIGNTPLLDLSKIAEKECPGVEIHAKAEWHNAGGSVKARPALNMVLEGERTGLLRPGMILLDSTSGNTGVAYAMIGQIKGYQVKLVMPQNVCGERKQLMSSSYHSEIVYSSPLEGSDGAIELCSEIYHENPEIYFWPDQYNNDNNWKAHYKGTAEEIWRQTNGRVTHFVAGLGTTGTAMGTSRGLKERFNKNVLCYAMEPAESLHGVEGLKHMGSSIVPGIYKPEELDGNVTVKTEEAYEMVARIHAEYGLFVGSSSGAAVAAAVKIGKTLNEGVVVTVLPDSCECEATTGGFFQNL